jgi:uncharacterized Zn finger protein
MEEDKVICPKCGNEENFHFNYDYSKKELPIIDVLCNECGEFFELENSKQIIDLIKKAQTPKGNCVVDWLMKEYENSKIN